MYQSICVPLQKSAQQTKATMVATALARHKPSTQLQYDVDRRLAARWLLAEDLTTLSFHSFRQLAWDMQDAGYCGAYLRLVHNATAEVLESIGARPFYWEHDGFRSFYLGQSAAMSVYGSQW